MQPSFLVDFHFALSSVHDQIKDFNLSSVQKTYIIHFDFLFLTI